MNYNSGNKNSVHIIVIFFIVFLCISIKGTAQYLDMMIILPKEGEKVLTEDQRLLYSKTWAFEGKDEAGPLQACEDLLKDPTLPYDVYRWAFLRRIEHYTITNRETMALQIGHQWLREHPDDPLNINVSNTLINICATRGHDNFKPTVKDLEAAAEPVFQKHSPYDLRVVHAHKAYAFGLYQFGIETNDTQLYSRALSQLQEADTILVKMLEMPALLIDLKVSAEEITGKREEIAAGISSVSATLETARAQEQKRMEHQTETATEKAWQGLLEKGE
jgi:hypothetical protein